MRHYIVLVKYNEGKWWEIDDEKVTAITEEIAFQRARQDAVLAFYVFSEHYERYLMLVRNSAHIKMTDPVPMDIDTTQYPTQQESKADEPQNKQKMEKEILLSKICENENIRCTSAELDQLVIKSLEEITKKSENTDKDVLTDIITVRVLDKLKIYVELKPLIDLYLGKG